MVAVELNWTLLENARSDAGDLDPEPTSIAAAVLGSSVSMEGVGALAETTSWLAVIVEPVAVETFAATEPASVALVLVLPPRAVEVPVATEFSVSVPVSAESITWPGAVIAAPEASVTRDE